MHNAKYAQIRSRMLQEDPSSIRSPFDMATLRYILHHTKKGTAPGLDNVGYDTLRTLLWLEDCPDDDEESSLTAKKTNEAREAILSLLLGLINTVLQIGVFPDSLKKGEIIVINEKGDPR
jgi:hypothetical protein